MAVLNMVWNGGISKLLNQSQQLLWIFLWNSRIMLPRYRTLTGLLSFFEIFPVCRTMSDRICVLCTDRDYRNQGSTSTYRSSTIRKHFEKENKLVNLRYLGYTTAKLQKNISSSCWDPFASFNVPTNSHRQRYCTLFNLIVLRRLCTLVHKILHRC